MCIIHTGAEMTVTFARMYVTRLLERKRGLAENSKYSALMRAEVPHLPCFTRLWYH